MEVRRFLLHRINPQRAGLARFILFADAISDPRPNRRSETHGNNRWIEIVRKQRERGKFSALEGIFFLDNGIFRILRFNVHSLQLLQFFQLQKLE